MVATLVGASLVAGCFGGDGVEPLTKAEFLERADAICRSAAERVAEIEAPSLSDPQGVQRAIEDLVRIQRRAVRELRALTPPEVDQPGVDAWLENVVSTLDQIERVAEGLATGDGALVADANERGVSFNDTAEELAYSYGLRDCAGTLVDELTPTSMTSTDATAP